MSFGRIHLNKALRIASISIGALILVSWLFTSFFLEGWMERKMVTAIADATNNRYRISLDDLHIDLWSQNFTVTGLHLTRDTTVSDSSGIPLLDQNDLDAKLNLNIQGWNIKKLVFQSELDLGTVTLDAPEIRYHQLHAAQAVDTSKQPMAWTVEKLRAIASGGLQQVFRMDRFAISNGRFWFYKPNSTEPYFQIHGFRTGLRVMQPQMSANELMKDLAFQFDSLKVLTITGEVMRLEQMALNDTTITLKRITLEPTYSRQESAERKGFQASWVHVDMHDIQIMNIQNQRWIEDLVLAVHTVKIDSMWIESYRDKSIIQEDPRHKPLPIQLLESLPFRLAIDTLAVAKGKALIVQEQEGKQTTGHLTLERMRAKAYPLHIYGDTAKDLHVEGFMSINGAIGVNIRAHFLANTPGYPFALSAWSSGGSLTSMNGFLEPEVGLRLQSGQCHSLRMDIYANDVYATGTLDFEYSDLVVEPASDNEGISLKTLIGNAVIRNKNLKSDKNFREASIAVEREQYKQVFRYVYICMRNGLKETVGISRMKPSLKDINWPDPKTFFGKQSQD